jgi:hypothetical protein
VIWYFFLRSGIIGFHMKQRYAAGKVLNTCGETKRDP